MRCSLSIDQEVIGTVDFEIYSSIQNKLRELQNSGIIDYAEPCLSQKHFLE